MTPEIPKGWEKCSLGESTHQLLPSGLTRENSDSINGIFVSEQNPIYRMDFELLGIIPIRKVQPIEFTVTEVYKLLAEGSKPIISGIEGATIGSDLIGKTFREVIE